MFRFGWFCTGLVLACTTVAPAAEVHVTFEGTVTSFTGFFGGTALPDRFDAGDTVTGSLTYDPTVASNASSSFADFYPQTAPASFEATIGVTFSSNDFRMGVGNSSPGQNDLFEASAFPASKVSLSGWTPPPLKFFNSFNLQLFDGTGTVFDDKSLPTALSDSSFDLLRMRFEVGDSDTGFVDSEMRVTLTSVSSTFTPPPTPPVPEPGSLALLGIGGLGLLAGRRRTKSRSTVV